MFKRRAVFAMWLVLGAGLPPALAADTADEWAAVNTDPAHCSAGLLITTLHQAARMPTLPLYGAPDPRDGMFASLVGAPEYEALLTRSRDAVDAERQRLGLGALRREGN